MIAQYSYWLLMQASTSFLESFLTLPALLAHMGWGVMRLYTKDSCFALGNNFFLRFTVHKSVEAAVWRKKEAEQQQEDDSDASEGSEASSSERAIDLSRPPVCTMISGYITGTTTL